ncbi:MAG: ferredoxin--NADP reductase [Labilithrix sp.]|nr:ferredoxin--NADP reductase [Labilithrix sp.]
MLPLAIPRSWSSALVQLERDLTMVRRRLAGDGPSPVCFARRAPGPALLPEGARRLVVARTVRETHDVVTLVLEDPERADFAFTAGQFFTLLVDVDGETVARNYSASNAPGQRELHVTIKAKPGGRVSGRLCRAAAGDRIGVLGPFGAFTVKDAASPRRLVLFAGGVGITPLLSIARTVLAAEPEAEILLVYANRRREDIAFDAELDALAAAHGGRLAVHRVLEEPPRGWTGATGRLDRANVARILDGLPSIGADAELFVCGPEGMQDEVLAALAARGTTAIVKRERFAIGGTASPRAGDRDAAARRITIIAPDRLIRTTALAGASLLEAGLAASAPMPFSCGVGGCGACRVRVREGEVDLDEPHCLSEEELAAGYSLACVGRPRGACTIEIGRPGREGGER